MVDFNKEELLKVAKLSSLELDEHEVQLFEKQIHKILNFAEELQRVAMTAEVEPMHNKNVFREDVVKPCNADDVLAQAPQREDRYFVVPRILD